MILKMIENNLLSLRYVKEQTPELYLVAVKRDEWALEYVD